MKKFRNIEDQLNLTECVSVCELRGGKSECVCGVCEVRGGKSDSCRVNPRRAI